MSEKIAVSFSGGRSSAVMAKLCVDQFSSNAEIVTTFCNTGCEHPATLDFVDRCDREWGLNVVWLEAVINPEEGIGTTHKVVDFKTASREGQPFEDFIKKYGIPNQTSPKCSSVLKEDVMKSYRKSIGWVQGKGLNFVTAIGIRADEMERVYDSKRVKRMAQKAGIELHEFEKIKRLLQDNGFIYPLIDLGFTKDTVNQFMQQQAFDLEIPSDAYGNCVWCWKKTDRKLYTLARESPEVFDFPKRMEAQYDRVKGTAKAGKDGVRRFFRQYRSVDDLISESGAKNFTPYRDCAVSQPGLFDPDLDFGLCAESCEVFSESD
jgi:3'-phosphoadenosine 5'-phosphosulfate sulfotransferase (PAPS reductase)/FAD synthetase